MEETKIAFFLADFDHQVIQIEKIYARLDTKSKSMTKGQVRSETVITRVLKENNTTLEELRRFKEKVSILIAPREE